MIDKIIYIYEKQNIIYSEITDILSNIKPENKCTEYSIALDMISDKLLNIDELTVKLEELKNEYVIMKGISGFVGKEIVKVETESKYVKLKQIIKELSENIILSKKLQDKVIVNINKESAAETKSSGNGLNNYTKRMKEKENYHKNPYFDMKK